MTQEPNFDIAHAIATQLSSERTDHNELAKASTYLNQTQNPADFFDWLEWMATDRVSKALARSNRTPVYYQQIRNACRQLKAIPYPEDATEQEQTAIMAQTLAWAVRLMRYMPVAGPIEGEASLNFNGGATRTSQRSTASTATATVTRPRSIRDLQPGMKLSGTVKRTAPFGAFVDVGVGRDGLVHISKLRQDYVSEVESVVKQGETVTVWVEEVDAKQGRIGLTMIEPTAAAPNVTAEAAAEEATWAEAPSTTDPKETPASVVDQAQTATEAAPTPPAPAKTVAVTLTAPDQVMEGLLVKGTVQKVEQSRLVVDIGLEKAASLTFDRLPITSTDPDEVAAEWPAGKELEAVIVRVSKKGVVQLTLAEE